MKTEKLQALIDGKLSDKEKKEFISNIKQEPKLKQELANLIIVKEKGREEIRSLIKETINKTNYSPVAKYSLASIRRAAFGVDNGSNVELTYLPIKLTNKHAILRQIHL